MEINTLLAIIITGCIFTLINRYLPSYATEKGKNLASKEDLANLTKIVEDVKSVYITDLEHVKAGLLSENQLIERRRHVYEEISLGLKILIAGHKSNEDAIERFHNAYATAWLWASDEVLTALNQLLKLQVSHGAHPNAHQQTEAKKSYTAVILAMRKDTGFSQTTAQAIDYQFVTISQ